MREMAAHGQGTRVGDVVSKRIIGRVDLLRYLHETMKFVLKPLFTAADAGMLAVIYDGIKRILHYILASYVEDNPEEEELLGVKLGVRTTRPCHRFLSTREQFSISVACT